MGYHSREHASALRRLIHLFRDSPAGAHPFIATGFGITALVAVGSAADDLYARLPSDEWRSAWSSFFGAAGHAIRDALVGGTCLLLAEECKVSLKEDRNGRAALAALGSGVAGLLVVGHMCGRFPQVKRLFMGPLTFIMDHAEGFAGALLATVGAVVLAKAAPSLLSSRGDVAHRALACGGVLSLLAGGEMFGRHLDVPVLRSSLSGPINALTQTRAGQITLGAAMVAGGCATLADGARQLLRAPAAALPADQASAAANSLTSSIRSALSTHAAAAGEIFAGAAAASFGCSIAQDSGEGMATSFTTAISGACRLAFGAVLARYAGTSLLLNKEALGFANVAAATGAAVLTVSSLPPLAWPLTRDLQGGWAAAAKVEAAAVSAGSFALAAVLGRHSMACLRSAGGSSLPITDRLKDFFLCSCTAQAGIVSLGAGLHFLVVAARDTFIQRGLSAARAASVDGMRIAMKGPEQHPWLTLAVLSAVGYFAVYGTAGLRSVLQAAA